MYPAAASFEIHPFSAPIAQIGMAKPTAAIEEGESSVDLSFTRQYFNGDDAEEREIRNLSDSLLNRVDWSFFTMPDTGKYSRTISLGWDKDNGFNKLGWWGYTEALFLYIVSAGMNYPYAEQGYQSWLSFYQWREPYGKELGHIVFPSMFIHQYSFIWLDMRGLQDRYVKKKGLDYFENSRRAAYVQWEYAIDNPNKWVGYDSLTWGLTACDGPGSKYNSEHRTFWDYSARGTSGPDSTFDDGTLAPTAVAGSIPFAPEITIPTLINMDTKYGRSGLTGKYGLVDSFNPTLEWFNKDYLGIDQGPIVLMIENFYSGFVWKYFMKDPIVQNGLKRLGFEKIDK